MFSDFSPLVRFTGKLEIIKPLRSAKRKGRRRRRRRGVENTKSPEGSAVLVVQTCRGDMRKMGATGEKGGQGGKGDGRVIGGVPYCRRCWLFRGGSGGV